MALLEHLTAYRMKAEQRALAGTLAELLTGSLVLIAFARSGAGDCRPIAFVSTPLTCPLFIETVYITPLPLSSIIFGSQVYNSLSFRV